MELTYNNVPHSLDKNDVLDIMPIHEFIVTFQYPIDQLYVDKFWESINKDSWIVVDYSMLKWMGYDCVRDRDNKRKYLELLTGNFIAQKQYDIANKDDTRIRDVNVALNSTIVVRAKVFKKTLMMIRTERAETIRDYYILLEEIFIDHMRYTNAILNHNKILETNLLKHSIKTYKDEIKKLTSTQAEMNAIAIDNTPVEYHEYVYILTSKRYYTLNLFKIGKTISLKNRLSTYNTGNALDDDTQFYLCSIQTMDSAALEKQIHHLLKNFLFRKEWYHIHPSDLLTLVNFIANQQSLLKEQVNGIIDSQSDPKTTLTIDEFASQTTVNTNPAKYYERDGTFFCSVCNKNYKVLGRVLNHIQNNACKDSKTGNYQCDTCGKSFVVKHYYDKHIKANDCESKVFKCGICLKEYSSQKHYDTHMAQGCSLFKCNRCGKDYKNSRDLQTHTNKKIPCIPIGEVKPGSAETVATNNSYQFISETCIYDEHAETPLSVLRARFKEYMVDRFNLNRAPKDGLNIQTISVVDKRFVYIGLQKCRFCENNHKKGCCSEYNRTARRFKEVIVGLSLLPPGSFAS